MSRKGKIKSLLPGGNTSKGFYSYFQYIIDLKKAKKVYFLKGGPGTGKSSMMKKIGAVMTEKGYDIEFYHCSADPDSIDAIVIPKLGVAMVDGTSPHVIDPKYPGAIDTIIHLGDYWNEEGLRKNRDNIIREIDANGKRYKRTYKYLAAAKIIHDDVEWIYSQAMDFLKVNQLTNQIIGRFLRNHPDLNKLPNERHLFGSAYTHKGHIDYVETYISEVKNIYYIKGAPGTGKSTLLKKITKGATEKGYDIEVYHEPLEPEKIEHIIIPELNLAFTTNKKYEEKETFDLNQFIDPEKLNNYIEELKYSENLFKQLLQDVIDNLRKTKAKQEAMEEYYVPNIQFKKIDALREDIIKQILSFK
ncbi:PRK06851 family protein [Natronincola ferrireducens]|uniref:ATPase n=1 Tax=Natronincola ferrireducens TaxID=393762 RepID=A0A1G9BBN1_9FIRM|nr:PRK06851 family protein [Natronincola ferrireducens]SDK36500.1 hypothetical protein SAMN05660472_01121 [Natronincola ferrireducens]